MKSKHIKLLRIMLKTDEWMTANALATKLNLSIRSIKSYISEMNHLETGLILSSRQGYRVNKDLTYKILEKLTAEIPQSPDERLNYIVKKLLSIGSDHSSAIDLYDLSDEICVSYETVKKDLVLVRKKLSEFDLFINVNTSDMTIEGKELDKRKMFSNVLYEEFSENVLSVSAIQKVFPDYDIELLLSIIVELCKSYHYFINEYALINLVLDIAISIHRIKNNFTFAATEDTNNRYGIREQSLVKKIVDEIEKHYHITYNDMELNELTIILISSLMKTDFEDINNDNVGEFVGKECMDLVDRLKEEMIHYDFIDLNNPDFIFKFTIHIKNLLIRLQNGYITKNPLTEHIKTSCPLIFECAVGISDQIKQLTGYHVDEHEIAYIALHIGSLLRTQTSVRNKATCILLFPQYYDYTNRLIKDITEQFGTNLVINAIATSVRELKNFEKQDFIISTIQLPETIGMDTVFINPFLTDRDISTIQYKIDRIKYKKKITRLKKHLIKISNPLFFIKNHPFTDENEAIPFMIDLMRKEGYVEESFAYEVFERERNYSTAFGNIAVPHSMKMNALKTGMFVLTNEKAFPWGNNMVNIVLLFSINKDERALFYDIFDNLIVLLLEAPNANKVISCHTYDEFINTVINCF